MNKPNIIMTTKDKEKIEFLSGIPTRRPQATPMLPCHTCKLVDLLYYQYITYTKDLLPTEIFLLFNKVVRKVKSKIISQVLT